MIAAKVNGVDTPMRFSLDAMDAIEQATGKSVGELTFSVKTAADRAELLKIMAALIRGAGGDATADSLRKAMTPGELVLAVYRVADAINEGMRMESEKTDSDEEEDLVLAEIKKDEAPGD